MTKSAAAALLMLGAAVFTPESAQAQSAGAGGFYAGASVGAGRIGMEYAKTVDNTDLPADYPQRGRIYHTSDAASASALSGGLHFGYRLNADPAGSFFASLEVDVQVHGGKPTGMLPGAGDSEGRNQFREAWPDEWIASQGRSYGATLMIGTSPPPLASILGPGSSAYAFGGVRRMKAELQVDYHGCPNPRALCTRPEEFVSGTDFHHETLFAWTVGGGLEKTVGVVGIRSEVRYTRYQDKEWDTVPVVPVNLPVSLGGDQIEVSLTAIVYF